MVWKRWMLGSNWVLYFHSQITPEWKYNEWKWRGNLRLTIIYLFIIKVKEIEYSTKNTYTTIITQQKYIWTIKHYTKYSCSENSENQFKRIQWNKIAKLLYDSRNSKDVFWTICIKFIGNASKAVMEIQSQHSLSSRMWKKSSLYSHGNDKQLQEDINGLRYLFKNYGLLLVLSINDLKWSLWRIYLSFLNDNRWNM